MFCCLFHLTPSGALETLHDLVILGGAGWFPGTISRFFLECPCQPLPSIPLLVFLYLYYTLVISTVPGASSVVIHISVQREPVEVFRNGDINCSVWPAYTSLPNTLQISCRSSLLVD